ncbi:hypothetical protein Lalb_Chr06g0175591 [Lupinus albus]|uniref:Uncharacterized protein n=1 Tax=Lupinus albus TaxID=3870 RepID=A0A6A4QEE9_LUPAL|nr:hypothetical protein Lalb_Chr06g0175591 [Lupinus albus]
MENRREIHDLGSQAIYMWEQTILCLYISQVTVLYQCFLVLTAPPSLVASPPLAVSYSIALWSGVAAFTIWDWP